MPRTLVTEKRNEPPGDTNQNFNDMLTLRIAKHSCQLGGGKKLIALLALLAFLLSAPQAMFAYDFSQNGLSYDILSTEDKTCEVSDCSYNLSTVVIPSTVVNINNGTTYTVTSIGESAFRGCSSLTAVEIPNSVTSIGSSAFEYCSSLASIEIPSSITSIGDWAFSDCSSLTAVEIPSSVISIGNGAFSNCTGLTAVEIPSSVTSIGNSAFSGCSRLTAIEIPNSVTSIGNYAFYGCSSLTDIQIPNSVTSIGEHAFYGCSGLTAVEIPNSVTSIGYSAFEDCSNLSQLVIGNGQETLTIQSNTFSSCPITTLYLGRNVNYYVNFKSLETLTIGSSVTSIGDEAFYGCSGLTAVEIPSSVTSIGDEAFSGCSGLTAVEIPNSVTSIGGWAFSDCTSLTSIEIPSSVISIGNGAFFGCDRLHSVTIGAGVLSISSYAFGYQDGSYTYRPQKVIWLCNTPPEGYDNAEGSVNYVANTSYNGLRNVKIYPYLSSLFEVGGIKYVPVSPSERTCEAIDCAYDTTSVVRIGRTVNYQGVEMTVEDIRPYVCYDNDHMKALHLDGYVGDIGDKAFYDCDNLAGIIIPNTVDSLGASCFEGCTALTQAILGDSITEIPGSCFRDCSALPKITIPAAVKRIYNNVFEGCTSLANVTIADRDSVLTLGYNKAYYSSEDDEPMFADCPLNAVYIGGNISYSTDASDGYSPFYRNTSLESVTITDKETEISENEFYGCTNLKNVTLGDGIETIGSYAFSGCAALTDFTFGSSLKSIGEEAFSDCTAMTRLVSRTAEPPVCGPQALDDINKWTCKLYVPDASIDAYKAADQWKEFFFITTDIAHAVEDGGSPADRILSGRVQVFDLSGRQVKEARNANSIDEVLNGLPSGTYILRGSGAAMKVAHE